MLQTVEAIVDPSGKVQLLEMLHLDRPSRAVVTVLQEPAGFAASSTGATDVLSFLEQHRLPASARMSAVEIQAQIDEERRAWD